MTSVRFSSAFHIRENSLKTFPWSRPLVYQSDMMTLIELNKTNDSKSLKGRVQGFCGDPQIIERLREMGLHQGLEICSVGRAPFGGPLLFRFGNTVLALRTEEAQCMLIEIM